MISMYGFVIEREGEEQAVISVLRFGLLMDGLMTDASL